MPPLERGQVRAAVDAAVAAAKVTDVHTHLYPASFRGLLLFGLDELLTYHYLVAETFRWVDLPYDRFWAMPKREQADLVWRTLFLEHTPFSEACRGVVTALRLLGLDPSERNLEVHRKALAGRTADEQIETVFRGANVESAVMTNDPFDPLERACWLEGLPVHPKLRAALRVDRLLDWPKAQPRLREWGYRVEPQLTGASMDEVRRFLDDWTGRMRPVYLASSLGDDFAYPQHSTRGRLIDGAILPHARERRLPFALMVGVRRQVNPGLRDAGDWLGRSDIGSVVRICQAHPDVKFLCTALARENQHELAVAARKFGNLLPFGCWWFMNNPSLVAETTRMRAEMLGSSFVPQHSDARVLEQVLYKWAHSKATIAAVLAERYDDLLAAGWRLTREEVERDARDLLGGTFQAFLAR
jgi:hypothetical protein